MKRLNIAILLALLSVAGARAELVVRDETGAELRLPAPARRIVSLAPHVTEMLFAAGAGGYVVGTTDYSDYPPAAKSIPRIGGYSRIDLEAVAALKPDVVVGWESGNAAAAVAKLRGLGIKVYLTQPNRIEDIAGSVERIGRLAGTEKEAAAAAANFRERLGQLVARYSARPKLRVFYQIWKQPLMTINSKQIISDAIRLCGGRNVCAQLQGLAPTVSVEAVRAKRGRQAMPLESTGPGGVRGKERK